MKKYKDIISGSVLLAFSLFYLSQTFSIKKIPFIDPVVGSAMFPRIVACILILCSAVLIIQGVSALRRSGKSGKSGKGSAGADKQGVKQDIKQGGTNPVLKQDMNQGVNRGDLASESGKTLMEVAQAAENGPDASTDGVGAARSGNYKVLLVLGCFGLYAFFMDKIGFMPASFLYLWSQMIVMSHNRLTWKTTVLYGVLSLVLAALIFVLFRYGFGLIMPRARWF